MEKTQVNEILSHARRLHFAGIGGISMHSLALWAVRNGFAVTGSDRSESPILSVLRAHDIPVAIGQRPTIPNWPRPAAGTSPSSPEANSWAI